MIDWHRIQSFDTESFNSSEGYIHMASQFLAMVGKNFVTQEDDDSNANLEWDPENLCLVGREIPGTDGLLLRLNVPEFVLELCGNNELKAEFALDGAAKEEIFVWLKESLSHNGAEGELMFIDHYEVPEHTVDKGEPFLKPPAHDLATWSLVRANANQILEFMNSEVGMPSEIRVWPHHFDTGSYYAWGDDRSIGAGLAIADSLCPGPYIYIYGWRQDDGISYEHVPELTAGRWLVNGWKGAILPVEDLFDAEDQGADAMAFSSEAIAYLKSQVLN